MQDDIQQDDIQASRGGQL